MAKQSPSRPADAKQARPRDERESADFSRSAALDLVAEESGLYRLLIENIKDYAIFAIDIHGKVLSWNSGAERLKGYSAAEIIGKNFSLFYPPEDVAAGKPQKVLDTA